MNDPYWSTMFNDTARLQELDFLRTCFSLTPQHSTTGRDSTTASCCGRGGTGETQAPSRIKRLISRSVWTLVYQHLPTELRFWVFIPRLDRPMLRSLTKEWFSCAMPRRYSVLWNRLQGMISKYVFSVYSVKYGLDTMCSYTWAACWPRPIRDLADCTDGTVILLLKCKVIQMKTSS